MSFKQEYDERTGLLLTQIEDGTIVETWTRGKPENKPAPALVLPPRLEGMVEVARHLGLDDGAVCHVSKWVFAKLLVPYNQVRKKPYYFWVSDVDRFALEHSELVNNARDRVRRNRSTQEN